MGAAAEKAAQLGGRVLVQPHDDRRNVMIAVVADPFGAMFGLMEWHPPEWTEAPAAAEQAGGAK